ncbi:Trm112 family protein [Hydrogenothermus marinus]|uniref:UPF0434 protein CLV39_0950 n=1 Tax=Hydrogenothermus marinus TaxID=133270 RepID=A0A3M0C2W4_9AQUI|nr:Trm112 family protein [Hydrogenothermus marinus]RMA97292.1 hypothetical protein CLV39_0950 [Hydrogenothermus marinus]
MIDKKLLEILACPKCKKELVYNKEKKILICNNCKVYYEIIDNIPILLIEKAKPLS